MRDALDRLARVGLQSDTEFAETFARSKWRQSKWGARRIEQVPLPAPAPFAWPGLAAPEPPRLQLGGGALAQPLPPLLAPCTR